MMSFWQEYPVAGVAVGFVLGALGAYAVLYLFLRRAAGGPGSRLASLREAVQELGQSLQSSLTQALQNAERFGQGRQLGPDDRARVAAITEALSASLHRLATVLRLASLDGRACGAEQPFDLHELMSDLASLGGGGRGAPDKVRLRIDPRLPYRLVGDRASVRMALMALCASLHRPGGSVRLEVSSPGRKGREIVVRFEVAHLAPGERSDRPRHDDIRLAERIAVMLGGRLEVGGRDGKGGVLALEVPLGVQREAPGPLAEIASARVLLVSRRESAAQRLSEALAGTGVNLMTVATPEEAIRALGRAIRLSDRVDAVIVDAQDASDGGDELCARAGSVHTPVYLALESGAEPDAARARAFSGTLDLGGPAEILGQAIHAGITAQRVRTSGPLVQREPWAWGAGGARPRRRILVVDDNVTNLLIVENILRSAGYDVDVARSGEEALTRLLEGGYRLAILDLHMPGMDGVTLLKRYRGMRPRARIPIAFLTANTSMEATRECSDAGADAFLTKPIVLEDLLNTVETLLKDSEVHWLPGARARTDGAETPSEPSLVDRRVIRELGQIYRDDAQGVARVLDAFRVEAEELLQGMAAAVSTNSASAFRDHAHALWAAAVNVGATALATACRDAKAMGPVEFRREGAATVDRLREAFRATMIAFGEVVEEPTI